MDGSISIIMDEIATALRAGAEPRRSQHVEYVDDNTVRLSVKTDDGTWRVWNIAVTEGEERRIPTEREAQAGVRAGRMKHERY